MFEERRFGFEAFDCAPGLRLEAHEGSLTGALAVVGWRIWLTICGAAAAIRGKVCQSRLGAARKAVLSIGNESWS